MTDGPVPAYAGRVLPSGPAAVRLLDGVVVRKASVSAQDNNTYLITCRSTGEQLLIDAADDGPRIVSLVAEGEQDPATGGRGLSLVVTTHRHWDHHRALAQTLAETGARSAAGSSDADHVPVLPDDRLDHGDVVHLGALRLSVVHLRGHTPGSVALVLTAPDGSVHAFTGDSLFPGGVGNTDQDPVRFAALLDDVTARLFDVLPDHTWVYPGHGDDTTLGAERPHLREWRERGW